MRALPAIALFLAVAAPTSFLDAQMPTTPPGSPNPAAVVAGTYTADPNHTLVTWSVDHMGLSTYTGIFGDVSGTLTLDPRNLAATTVDITIPVSKVTTANAGLTAHLTRPAANGGHPDFFGPDMAPAHFVSTRVVVAGRRATVSGNLTLNGVTRPVTLAAQFHGAGRTPPQMGGKDNVGFNATATIRRSEFGLGFGVPLVSDEVRLDIAAAFQK
ncbi:YceI family protein [Sphingomonas sp.]|uniref:YceI family protein n=1 Tax=Sphingomonas sp. TaxID=28214 RepID=UPI003CC64DDC